MGTMTDEQIEIFAKVDRTLKANMLQAAAFVLAATADTLHLAVAIAHAKKKG